MLLRVFGADRVEDESVETVVKFQSPAIMVVGHCGTFCSMRLICFILIL